MKSTNTATGGDGHVFEQSFVKKPFLHLEHRQRELNVLQFCRVMLVMASPPQSPAEHVDESMSMSQINPDLELHATLPH